jgi:hypothetical protein
MDGIIVRLGQSPLFEHDFRTARLGQAVYCHQEFLDKLAARRAEPIGKRTALLMQKMAVDISRLHYKGTSGINKGWRRSRLGGGSGSHFYAWWAPVGAAPLKSEASFDQAQAEAVFLRDIRHHDDHAPLAPGHLTSDYLPMSVPDLRGSEYAPEPWTSSQVRFARSRAVARILKGHPGSGKTTALLHAADASQAERTLYLTFSQDLAALARDYFDRFCSNARTFTVMTFPAFWSCVAGGKTRPIRGSAGRSSGGIFRTISARWGRGRTILTHFMTRCTRIWSVPLCRSSREGSPRPNACACLRQPIVRNAPAIWGRLPTQ